MRLFFALVFLGLLSGVIHGVSALDGVLDISADSLELRHKEGYAVFSGHVVAKQKDMTLTADSVDAFYTAGQGKKDDKKRSSSGADGVDKVVAHRHVVLTRGADKATAEEAVYSPAAQTVTLKRNVVLVRGESVLKGDELVYDMRTGVLRLLPPKGDKGRVKMMFHLDELK